MHASHQRLKKEIEYNKRLRLGADQRANEFEDKLIQQRKQTSAFDESESSLVEQIQLLVSKNGELSHR